MGLDSINALRLGLAFGQGTCTPPRECFESLSASGAAARVPTRFFACLRLTVQSKSGWRRAGRPDEPGRLQASLRGFDAERCRSAGLLGDRPRSYLTLFFSPEFPVSCAHG